MHSTCLILRVCRKKLAIKVCREYDASRGLRVLGCDDIREPFRSIRCGVGESVLLDVPIELLHGIHDIVLDNCVILRIRRSRYENFRQVGRGVMRIHIANGVRRRNQ